LFETGDEVAEDWKNGFVRQAGRTHDGGLNACICESAKPGLVIVDGSGIRSQRVSVSERIGAHNLIRVKVARCPGALARRRRPDEHRRLGVGNGRVSTLRA
jgi:hypothetical protein